MKKMILILVFLLVLSQVGKCDFKVETSRYPMNVSLLTFYSITISDQLAQGIWFTNLTGAQNNIQYPLVAGSFDNNATFNYNKTDYKAEYWAYVYGNMKVDICNGAKYNLCSQSNCTGGGNVEIGIGNVTWSSSSSGGIDSPSLSNAVSMTLGYDNGNKVSGIDPNSYAYFRYWMDIPSNFPPYNFSTTYQIQAVPNGGTCV